MAEQVASKEKQKLWLSQLKVQPRDYQLELLSLAIEENTIVNLGTGAGKTFIAVMLIRELQHEIYGPWDNHKRTIFLVPSVPLVQQQAHYIKDHLSLNVGMYKGDMNVDNWDKLRWKEEFEKNHVLVMTHQIFLNILNHFPTEFPLSKINLLIIDECHHCTKSHPYREIMRHFESFPEADLPRVLGLTASLIKAKTKPHELESSIRKLESYMRCRCQTAADLIMVDNCATQPKESIVTYYTTSEDRSLDAVLRVLSSPLDIIQNFSKQQKQECLRTQDTCKGLLDDVHYTLESLGVSSAYQVAVEAAKTIQNIYCFQGTLMGTKDQRLLESTNTALRVFLHLVNPGSTSSGQGPARTAPVASKVNCLLRILGDYGIESGETNVGNDHQLSRSPLDKPDKLCGIVFVQRRSTAVRLCDLIDTLKKTQPDLQYIKCDYLVGHGAGSSGKEAMKASKQEDVLWRFRRKKTNLLIATSVVEEGLDVPHCNLIVRFDLPNDIRSYIQSKGRARARKSQYIMMVNATLERDQRGTLENYRDLETALRELVRKQRSVPSGEELKEAASEDVPPYQPYGEQGAKASLSSSLSLLHMYCQKLPHDVYTKVQPHFTVKKVPRRYHSLYFVDPDDTHTPAYVCTVTLPLPCPYREPIQGQEMETRRQAEQAAALKAVEVLHKNGLLDKYLLPTIKADEDSGSMDMTELKKSCPNAGTDRRRDTYKRHIPEILSACHPSRGDSCHLYVCHIKDSRGVYYQHSGEDTILTFGLLSRVPLQMHMVPRFSLFVREVELTVEVTEEEERIYFTPEELQVLNESHCYIMEGVLGISPPHLKHSPHNAQSNYLVVPMGIISQLSTCYVDTEMASTLAKSRLDRASDILGGCAYTSPHVYRDMIVSKAYTTGQSDCEMYAVVGTDHSTTPQTLFPYSAENISYAQYFLSKYNARLRNENQPALVCEPLSKRTDLLTSRFKTRKGEDHEASKEGVKDKRRILLFPEICKLHPVTAPVYRLLHCIPSVLWRIEAALTTDELRRKIQSATGVGVIERGSSEVITDADLRGFENNSVSSLKCLIVLNEKDFLPLEDRYSLASNNITSLVGPSNAVLIQALTLASAEDIVDLERLEILGDSFLKLSTSVSVFRSQKYHSEGQLTEARSKVVSNLNLFHLAKQKDIPSLIAAKPFRAHEMWIPPCYVVESGDSHVISKYTTSPFSDKSIADCVESLIGAYLSCGGMQAALSFMLWMGIELNVGNPSAGKMKPEIKQRIEMQHDYCPPSSFFELVTSPGGILLDFFPKWQLPDYKGDELEKLTVGLDTLEKELKYHFRDKRYLVEACTHASYVRNHVTNCYQKLEFLGDAVLDYLITTYIYWKFPQRSPGELTQLRSALVNNNTFAEMTLKLGLNRLLKHNSSTLFSEIENYLQSQKHIKQNPDHREIICGPSASPLPMPLSSPEDEEDEYTEMYAPKVLGDLIESVAGAIFMDSGMELRVVWRVFEDLFVPLIDEYSHHLPLNPVDQLFQENPNATFEKVRRDSNKKYSITVKVVLNNGEPPLVATGYSVTETAAKQIAAKRLIKKLQTYSNKV